MPGSALDRFRSAMMNTHARVTVVCMRYEFVAFSAFCRAQGPLAEKLHRLEVCAKGPIRKGSHV